ncbi:MAG: LPS export ABC transporter periplasmic protein LptC [bacterium]|nr:LPS export ABC transporter periplasmic protein LptC [bacterium]
MSAKVPLTAVVILLCLVGCRERTPIKKSDQDPFLTAPAHVSFGVTVKFTDSARTKAILRSTVARIFEDRQETTMGDTVIVDFYSVTSGKRVARLTADSAIVDDRTKNMIAIGHVVVYSDSSRTTLSTPRLLWENTREMMSSTEDVRIVTPRETILGTGFESDQYLTSYRIFKVHGRILP